VLPGSKNFYIPASMWIERYDTVETAIENPLVENTLAGDPPAGEP